MGKKSQETIKYIWIILFAASLIAILVGYFGTQQKTKSLFLPDHPTEMICTNQLETFFCNKYICIQSQNTSDWDAGSFIVNGEPLTARNLSIQECHHQNRTDDG